MATITEPLTPTTETDAEPEPEGFYEIIDGDVVEKPPMSVREVVLASRLHLPMGQFALTNALGQVVVEALFGIDPQRRLSLRPDLAFVSQERWPIDRTVPQTEAWDVIPDLAVEIIRRTNKTLDDLGKVEDYFRAGVRAVWLILPRFATVYVYDSPTSIRIVSRGEELDGGALLPGFRLPLATLFGEPEA
jgi:Uma2 family endonuclease